MTISTEAEPDREKAVTDMPPEAKPDQEKPVTNEVPPEASLASLWRLFWQLPRLPASMIIAAVLLILTDGAVTLMKEPPADWLGNSAGKFSFWLGGPIIPVNPTLVLCPAVALIVALVLWFLPRTPALMIWMFAFLEAGRDILFVQQCAPATASDRAGCAAVDLGWGIAIAGIFGFILAMALFGKPEPRRVGFRRWGWRLAGGLMACLWLGYLVWGVQQAATAPYVGWQPIKVDRTPLPKNYAAVAYDTARNRAVMFGGALGWTGKNYLDDGTTWEWDGTTWRQASPQTSPSARMWTAMAYDEKRKVSILYGGRDAVGPLADTWEWDGTNWTLMHPQDSPGPRCCHQMLYDPQLEAVVLYGGNDAVGDFFNDAWEWNGQDWAPITFKSTSPVASGFDFAYDLKHNQITAFLNGSPSGTWIWSGDGWQSPVNGYEAAPPPRESKLVYDPEHNVTVMFGGDNDKSYYNDTWLFDGSTWKELVSPLKPSARWGHMMFFDRVRHKVVLFGGFDSDRQVYLNDMWELTLPK